MYFYKIKNRGGKRSLSPLSKGGREGERERNVCVHVFMCGKEMERARVNIRVLTPQAECWECHRERCKWTYFYHLSREYVLWSSHEPFWKRYCYWMENMTSLRPVAPFILWSIWNSYREIRERRVSQRHSWKETFVIFIQLAAMWSVLLLEEFALVPGALGVCRWCRHCNISS